MEVKTQMKATVSAEWLLRKDVYGPEEDGKGVDKIGTVNDIIMELGEGCSSWLVVRADGDRFPVPWSAVGLDDERRITTDLEASRLQNAPRFDPKSPPDFTDERWSRSVYSYWGVDYDRS